VESEVKVTVSGARGAGKSTLAYLLKELLSTRGVGVYGENPEDGGAHSFRVNSAESFAAYTEAPRFIDVVFDGPPGHESGRFVEVEDESGASVSVGEWVDRGNGLWALRIPR
jgi:energy-coupling factor transporter ATP-binding protein EcfA2